MHVLGSIVIQPRSATKRKRSVDPPVTDTGGIIISKTPLDNPQAPEFPPTLISATTKETSILRAIHSFRINSILSFAELVLAFFLSPEIVTAVQWRFNLLLAVGLGGEIIPQRPDHNGSQHGPLAW